MSELYICFRDDGQVIITVYKKGRGEQTILTDRKTALKIRKSLYDLYRLVKEKKTK